MDLIGGIVISTSVLIFSMSMVTLFARIRTGEQVARQAAFSNGLTQKVLAVSLVVYFVALVNLLLIAQQVNLALGSFVVGIVLIMVYFVEPAVRARTSQATEETESWED